MLRVCIFQVSIQNEWLKLLLWANPQESVNQVVINHYKQEVTINEYTALTLAYVSTHIDSLK